MTDDGHKGSMEELGYRKRKVCSACHGLGFIEIDFEKYQPCSACCPHDKGFFELTEAHGIQNKGKLCCRNGCGFMKGPLMEYELVIKADANDANYVTSTNTVTMEDIEKLKPVVEAIKAFSLSNVYENNFPQGDCTRDKTVEEMYSHVDQDALELFCKLCPYGEYGIHTIESVVYYPVPDKTVLL